MKHPKERKTFCPKCKESTLHKVKEVKKRSAGSLGQSQRQHIESFDHGYHSKPKGMAKQNFKTAKRRDIRLTCSKCNKSRPWKSASKAKKFELV